MKRKKQFPLLLLLSSCSFFLELHADTSPLMMWRLGQRPERREPIVKAFNYNQDVSSERSDTVYIGGETKAINEEEYRVLTNEEIDAQISKYQSEQRLRQRNTPLAPVRNFHAVTASFEYAKLCLSKMNRKTTSDEKAAWSELAYYSFQKGQADAVNNIERAQNCARAIAAMEDSIRSVRHAVITSSIVDQEIFKNEASYHRQRAMEEMRGNRVEAERKRQMAVAMKEMYHHVLKPSGVETAQQQKAEEQQEEATLREAYVREVQMTNEVREGEENGEVVFAAEQAAEYGRRAQETNNQQEKGALEKAVESSLERSYALANDKEEEAMHFFMAASYQADAASLFKQANQEASLDKKREYVQRAQYYLEHARLWREHQIEAAQKFSYKKFQQRALLVPLQQQIASENTAYSQFDDVDEEK